MTFEEIIIGLVRILGSLPVLKWALFGAILAILIDFSDLFMMNLLSFGGIRNYQAFDKWVDLIYMATFLIASIRWTGPSRLISIVLFVYRIIGVALFELIGWRGLLLFFPNVFETWFIFVAAARYFKPNYKLTWHRSFMWLIPIIALKELQEYVLHWWKFLDKFRAIDVVVDWWQFIVKLFT